MTYIYIGIAILVIVIIIVLLMPGGKSRKSKYKIVLKTKQGKITFYNPFANFLIYGGAGSGKTKSLGKPIMGEYYKNNFAGFIYDYKDYDLTKTAYNFSLSKNYPYSFYYISFKDMQRTYRTNPISPKVIDDDNLFLQLLEDLLYSYSSNDKGNEWLNGALGILKGTAIRFYKEYPDICTIPHIVNFLCYAGAKKLSVFLESSFESRSLAAAFLDAKGSPKTQASYLSSLTNYLSALAYNKNIAYVLSGNDFDFNLIDPNEPKLLSVANSYQIEGIISPVIGLMISISSRHFTMNNKIDFVYTLDEATTSKIRDFEKMPSVLREYRCAFMLLTQSGAKIEKLYGKLDRSSIEANFGNQFFGRTKDIEALKTYQLLFGKKETQRITKSKGANVSGKSSSTSISTQKEERYDIDFFTKLKPGEFVGSGTDASVANIHRNFIMYDDSKEVALPIVKPVLPIDIEENYNKIKEDVLNLISD